MEQKTAEEILRENGVTPDGENITQWYRWLLIIFGAINILHGFYKLEKATK